LLDLLSQTPEIGCQELELMYDLYKEEDYQVVDALLGKSTSEFDKLCAHVILDELRDLSIKYCNKSLKESWIVNLSQYLCQI